MVNKQRRHRATADRRATRLAVAAMGFLPLAAHASLFTGDTLDKVADVMAWVVICVVPIIGIAVFWIVHVLPEKIAHKRHHPQTAAIQTLCLLSLVFGGLLWPIAWLWAYTKPIGYKLAYGTEKGEHYFDEQAERARAGELAPEELEELRHELDVLSKRGPLPPHLARLREAAATANVPRAERPDLAERITPQA
jgi:CBS domain containing-hemolysin-like protein